MHGIINRFLKFLSKNIIVPLCVMIAYLIFVTLYSWLILVDDAKSEILPPILIVGEVISLILIVSLYMYRKREKRGEKSKFIWVIIVSYIALFGISMLFILQNFSVDVGQPDFIILPIVAGAALVLTFAYIVYRCCIVIRNTSSDSTYYTSDDAYRAGSLGDKDLRNRKNRRESRGNEERGGSEEHRDPMMSLSEDL